MVGIELINLACANGDHKLDHAVECYTHVHTQILTTWSAKILALAEMLRCGELGVWLVRLSEELFPPNFENNCADI